MTNDFCLREPNEIFGINIRRAKYHKIVSNTRTPLKMRVNAGVSTPLLNICKGMYDYVIHMMQCMIRLSSVDTVIS
jgi:hypothetical protein